MTAPTESQIRAVEQVLRGLVIITGDSTWDMNYVARKVLETAAQVRPTVKDLLQDPVAALNHAAQVGEPTESERWQAVAAQGIQIERELRTQLLTIKAATIERCKQVVDKYAKQHYSLALVILTELEKLKDEPV
jgi:hypothetical protein